MKEQISMNTGRMMQTRENVSTELKTCPNVSLPTTKHKNYSRTEQNEE